MSAPITPETCPEREHHGKPFRYCPVRGCGWIEPTEPKPEDPLIEAGRAAVALALAYEAFWAAVRAVEAANRAARGGVGATTGGTSHADQ